MSSGKRRPFCLGLNLSKHYKIGVACYKLCFLIVSEQGILWIDSPIIADSVLRNIVTDAFN